MSARTRVIRQRLLLIVWLTLSGSPAWARQALHLEPAVETSPVEVTLGISVAGPKQNVNAPPYCVELSLPCTDKASADPVGFGIAVAIARNVSDNLAIVGDLGLYSYQWTSRESYQRHRTETNVVRSVLLGPRLNTPFLHSRTSSPRFFGQVLVGIEDSGTVPARPAAQFGGGVDGLDLKRGPQPTVRLEVDYRVTPGGGQNLSGWRFLIGITMGPHVR
jgi:hypothetical protein